MNFKVLALLRIEVKVGFFPIPMFFLDFYFSSLGYRKV